MLITRVACSPTRVKTPSYLGSFQLGPLKMRGGEKIPTEEFERLLLETIWCMTRILWLLQYMVGEEGQRRDGSQTLRIAYTACHDRLYGGTL
jgi:hypothetical protein